MSRGKASPPSQRTKVQVASGGPPKLVTRDVLAQTLEDFARKTLGIKIEVEGADRAMTTHDSMRFKVRAGGDIADHPWRCKIIDGAFTMMGGFYNSHELAATVLGTGSGWAWVKAEWALTLTGSYVSGASNTSAVIQTGSSVPADDPDGATFYVPLVQFSGGRVLSQAATRSISATVCDNGGDGSAQHNVLQS